MTAAIALEFGKLFLVALTVLGSTLLYSESR